MQNCANRYCAHFKEDGRRMTPNKKTSLYSQYLSTVGQAQQHTRQKDSDLKTKWSNKVDFKHKVMYFTLFSIKH
jgi:hypothetical protein